MFARRVSAATNRRHADLFYSILLAVRDVLYVAIALETWSWPEVGATVQGPDSTPVQRTARGYATVCHSRYTRVRFREESFAKAPPEKRFDLRFPLACPYPNPSSFLPIYFPTVYLPPEITRSETDRRGKEGEGQVGALLSQPCQAVGRRRRQLEEIQA